MASSRLIVIVTAVAVFAGYLALISADQMPLSTLLPKLQAIHEDSQNLLIKNSELKAKILVGLQTQNEAKLKHAKESRLSGNAKLLGQPPSGSIGTKPTQNSRPQQQQQQSGGDKNLIDYAELEEFNKWVEHNLEYAVKNTQASADALKEEAQQNNGNVDYSDQAIKDGIEGVKYWQSAVIFQDKTLNHEKYDVTE